jgi:hypothetical protein
MTMSPVSARNGDVIVEEKAGPRGRLVVVAPNLGKKGES